MTLAIVSLPLEYFPDPNRGRPIYNGQIFVGEPDLDPEILANRKAIVARQEDGTDIPISPSQQPVRTGKGGVPEYNGATVQILVDGNYSIKVLNNKGAQTYYAANVLKGVPITTETIGDYAILPSTIGDYTDLVFSTVADMVSGTTNGGEVINYADYQDGTKLSTMGYFSRSDGGSNWGSLRFGAHVDDGGRIISIDAGTYVEMNMVGVINIRKWGCDDSLPDNSPQWQKAQDYADTVTGSSTRIPRGNFTCLSPIGIGQVAGVEGIGYRSRPTFLGCNAFNFVTSGIPSGRAPFNDFWVIGNKTAGTIAFSVDTGESGVALAIKGLTFKNITCDGFEEAWRLSGAWNCEISKCDSVNCWHGVNLLGRNVHTVIKGCNLVRGSTALGSGTSTGVRQYIDGGVRSEGITIRDTLVFGFDWGVDITNCLEFHADVCDVDFAVRKGFRVVGVNGGGSIKSSWIYLVDAVGDEVGIDFVDVASDSACKFNVMDNYIERQTQGSLAGMTGISVGVNHRYVDASKNTIRKFHTAFRSESEKCKYTDNVDTGTASASVSLTNFANNCEIKGNEFSGIINKGAATKVLFGHNDGVTTQEVFTVTLPAAATSITTTWAALGLPDAPLNCKFSVSVNNTTTTNLGWMRGRAATASVTVDVETAPVGNTEIDVTVTAF